MMKLSHVLIAVVLIAAAVYFVSQRSGATEITQTGSNLSIAIGPHRLQAVLDGSEYADSYLVVGGMQGGEAHFNALLSVIPLDTARDLAARYGNFRRCGSPGAPAGMRSAMPMALYAANGSVERNLKRINKLALAGKDPIIKMDFAGLEITSHAIEHGDQTMEVPLGEIAPFYLVRQVQLVRQGMEF
jgi:hypothetical protein